MSDHPVLWRNVDKDGKPGLRTFDCLEDTEANNRQLTLTFWMCAPWTIQPLYTRAPLQNGGTAGDEVATYAARTLRSLAGVIRKHGTCAPMALEMVADKLEAALAADVEAGE